MGLTKTNLFTPEQNELAELAKAIGHPARVAMLQHIITAEGCINTDLVNELGLAQATVSQHLKELKKIGLIKGTIEGTAMCYCIDSDRWNEVKSVLIGLFEMKPACSDSDCC